MQKYWKELIGYLYLYVHYIHFIYVLCTYMYRVIAVAIVVLLCCAYVIHRFSRYRKKWKEMKNQLQYAPKSDGILISSNNVCNFFFV